MDLDTLFPSWGGEDEAPPEDEDVKSASDAEKIRNVAVLKTMSTHRKMRLMSEQALAEAMDWHLEPGVAYHVVSYGDVDALTFLRRIAQDQRLDYVILSTWCMAQVDAEEIDKWVRRGIIGRIDYVVGEVFRSHARYREIRKTMDATAHACGGRVLRCRNHSKVMVCYGREYDAVVESSANVDTNPRCEQTCVTVDTPLADFYREWFDQLPDFDGGFPEWKPWSRASA